MINLDGVNLNYQDKQLFTNLSLNIADGEKVLLDSPSGSGKSTFLKMIMGFVQPVSGAISISGRVLNPESVRDIRLQIGYLPQELNFANTSVERLIKDVLNYSSNRHIRYDEDKILGIFNELQLDEAILKQSTTSLSGGEKQRIGVTLMKLVERKIYLLDEVTSALNFELKELITAYFLKMDNTVVIVSHDDCWSQSRVKKLRWHNGR